MGPAGAPIRRMSRTGDPSWQWSPCTRRDPSCTPSGWQTRLRELNAGRPDSIRAQSRGWDHRARHQALTMILRRRGSIPFASLSCLRRRLLVMWMSHSAHSSASIVQPALLACRPSSLQDPSSDRHPQACPSSQRRSTEEEGRRLPWQEVHVPPCLRPLFLPARSFHCRPWRLVRARRQTGTRCVASAVHGGCAAGGHIKSSISHNTSVGTSSGPLPR